ncbi:Facilitated trehalose transporter Tret1 [Eumeta japonica]|uniref:Facilitated trehalose transporter Tret1 n=1 Tax=Eumeta variegata TaxID=151549 RepID=A0A4C1XHJ3_EUMVA|nr:Facilitated trehalose transporter Tret1 [Eumeta japonica]
MEPYEIALYGSLSCVGALIGTPLSGYLLDRIGRKYSSLLGGLPFLISWSIIANFNQVEAVLFSQFLAGIGGASFVISPVFSSEICQDSIRGTVTAGSMIFYGLGILFSYVMIACLPYYTLIHILVTMTALYMLCVVFLKDSPVYLLTVGKEEEAAKSIAFYRSVDPDTKEVLDELSNMKRLINFENAGTTEEEKLKPEIVHSGSKEKISPIKYLCKTE